MSLFGDDDSNTPPRPGQSSSLFDDDPKPAGRPGNSLFADDLGDNDSPWAFPTPKKAGREALVRSLLPPTDVPDSYIDAFDALLDAGHGHGNGISLWDSRPRPIQDPRDCAARRWKAAELGRNEFNVVFALIGLAQEHEDITLDSVDERKRNLPVPTCIPSSNPQRPATRRLRPAPCLCIHCSSTTAGPHLPTLQLSAPADPATAIACCKQSSAPHAQAIFGDPEADPPRSSIHTRGRTTSQFTTHSTQTIRFGKSQPVQPSSLGSEVVGGGYNGGANQPFAAPTMEMEALALLRVEKVRLMRHRSWVPSIGRLPGASGNDEVITITALSEEGRGVLHVPASQLRSRQLATHNKESFVDTAISFVNGNPIAADATFLEKRRKGLARFTNALVRHPVLNQEQLVVMFLTVPTVRVKLAQTRSSCTDQEQELAVWRKQANSLCTGRIHRQTPSSGSRDSYQRPFLTSSTRSGQGHGTSIRVNSSSKTSKSWEEGVLEDLKRQKRHPRHVRDMFDRRDKYAKGQHIPNWNDESSATRAKLSNYPQQTRRKPGEAEKGRKRPFSRVCLFFPLFDSTSKSCLTRNPLSSKHARGVFIRECIRDELLFFQKIPVPH
ncbi:hypothetical protein J3E73DRAFT_411904 [Bipolaris maydis]|nr:hypothetical protein J3E73DRAFT_411904 [Bipolaris maydis]